MRQLSSDGKPCSRGDVWLLRHQRYGLSRTLRLAKGCTLPFWDSFDQGFWERWFNHAGSINVYALYRTYQVVANCFDLTFDVALPQSHAELGKTSNYILESEPATEGHPNITDISKRLPHDMLYYMSCLWLCRYHYAWTVEICLFDKQLTTTLTWMVSNSMIWYLSLYLSL